MYEGSGSYGVAKGKKRNERDAAVLNNIRCMSRERLRFTYYLYTFILCAGVESTFSRILMQDTLVNESDDLSSI